MMLPIAGLALACWTLATLICIGCFLRWWAVIPISLFLFITFFIPVWAWARDLDGQYANSPDHEWISTRRNHNNIPCCDIADGKRLEDIDWKTEGDSYSVRIDGVWVHVDPDKVLTEPNKIGTAMVWIWHGQIMCFIPGASG